MTFEEYFMKGIKINKSLFDEEINFKNCSSHFSNMSLDYCREVWDHQQKIIDELEKATEGYRYRGVEDKLRKENKELKWFYEAEASEMVDQLLDENKELKDQLELQKSLNRAMQLTIGLRDE